MSARLRSYTLTQCWYDEARSLTREQMLLVNKPANAKPRIRPIFGGIGYRCEGSGRFGVGVTVCDAYDNWLLSHMLPVVPFRPRVAP